MANKADTLKAGNIIEVTYTDLGDDWNYKDDGGFRGAIKVKSILWHPTIDGDKLVINEGGNDGPSIVHVEASADDETKHLTFDEGIWMKPYIDKSDCKFGTNYDGAASTKIIFILA